MKDERHRICSVGRCGHRTEVGMSVGVYGWFGVLVLGLVASGCGSPLASLGTTLADVAFAEGRGEWGERGQLVAEVIEVDELQRRVRVSTEDGRTGTILYDQNTVIVLDRDHRTVRALEPGDVVVIQVEEDGNRNLYAVRIDVQPVESAPDPTPDPEADPKPDPTPDPEADPEPDPEPDPKPDPRPDPKPDPKPDPRPDPDPGTAEPSS
jgi:hypothetical protein